MVEVDLFLLFLLLLLLMGVRYSTIKDVEKSHKREGDVLVLN